MLKRKRSTSNAGNSEDASTSTSSNEIDQMKRKCKIASTSSSQSDVYSRTLLTNTQGRGSLAGWTACPLCNANPKKYALGRGITMHLQQVHTPWNPGKAELARRERIRRRIQGLVHRCFKGGNENKSDIINGNKTKNKAVVIDGKDELLSDVPFVNDGESQNIYKERLLKHFLGNVWDRDGKCRQVKYEPTEEENRKWSTRLIDLARQLEETYEKTKLNESSSSAQGDKEQPFIQAGLDRKGNKTECYKDSLPPFIRAASDGNMDLLQQMVKDARTKCKASAVEDAVKGLLDTKDRNGSGAEHWAAGNGHLHCLQYLMSLIPPLSEVVNNDANDGKRRRKRDGKTSLHYAARNGHTHIIEYLLDPVKFKSADFAKVDVTSGDGTTPLHLACYGGHLETIQYLIEDHKADIYKVNDWNCGIGHWIAMSIQSDHERLVNILDYIKKLVGARSFEVFGRAQKQGHSSVHKAAQKLNQKVIEWIAAEAKSEFWTEEQRVSAGAEDAGGNKPSAIWCQMGGSKKFDEWMNKEFKW